MADPDNRFLDEIEREDSPTPPASVAALALTGAVLAAGVLVFAVPAVLILLFT